MISMGFNENLNIVEVIFKGKVELIDLLNFIANIGHNKHLQPTCRILVDASKAYYNFEFGDINKIERSVRNHTKDFESLRTAFVHINPNDTAISMVFETDFKALNYTHKTFSTRLWALEWLLVY